MDLLNEFVVTDQTFTCHGLYQLEPIVRFHNSFPVYTRKCHKNMQPFLMFFDETWCISSKLCNCECHARFIGCGRGHGFPVEPDFGADFRRHVSDFLIWGHLHDWEDSTGHPLKLTLWSVKEALSAMSAKDYASSIGRALTPEEKLPFIEREWMKQKQKLKHMPIPSDPEEADHGGWKSLNEVLLKGVYRRRSAVFSLRCNDRILDLGAHKLYFPYFVAWGNPDMHFIVKAYEPASVNFHDAQRNAKLLMRSTQKISVELLQRGVALREGYELFVEDPKDTWKCCLASEASEAKRRRYGDSGMVLCEALDSVLRDFMPHVCKLDIEGPDLEILASPSLDWSSVRVLFCEYSCARDIARTGPDAAKNFARVLINLRNNGFIYVDLPSEIFEPTRWNPCREINFRVSKDFVFVASKGYVDENDSANERLRQQWLTFIEKFYGHRYL